MANPDVRRGLEPVMHISGSAWNGQTLKCYIPATDGTAVFIGDTVALAGSADATGMYLTVTRQTVGIGSAIFGVVTSFEPDPTNLENKHRLASTARYCYVCVDPTVLYKVQGDSVAVIAATDVGSNFNLIDTHSGNTATGLSGTEINSSVKGTTATYQVKLIGNAGDPNDDISLVNAKWLVMINIHQLFAVDTTAAATVTGAIGV